MSYDIYLKDGDTQETLELKVPHAVRGGIFKKGNVFETWLNITYNYSDHFYRIFGIKGIRSIYGKTGKASIPMLERAIEGLGDETHVDYWQPAEGNVKIALQGLLFFAKAKPDGVWMGD